MGQIDKMEGNNNWLVPDFYTWQNVTAVDEGIQAGAVGLEEIFNHFFLYPFETCIMLKWMKF